jgi:citrate lyase beta subunit
MSSSFSPELTGTVFARLRESNASFNDRFPGESSRRQPVHTVYGGAQIFKADTARKLGAVGLASLKENAPDAATFAKAVGLAGKPAYQKRIYARIVEKLKREPVEDFRIDFEDGYGNRPDAEEDHHAVFTAREMARGMAEGLLPPFIGIRIKPLTEELKTRSVRTLDLFLSTFLEATGSRLPEQFVVTLPKVTVPEQVSGLVELFREIERRFGLAPESLKLELMMETPQSMINHRGETALPILVAAAEGRCVAVHFGVYDYTASLNITAAFQSMVHPACDFARAMMKVALAGTGVWICDGATNVMPVGPHRPREGRGLTQLQRKENRRAVHRIWRLNFEHVRHSLMNGYYQGWDLHPAQLPVRYAAVYAFFLDGLDAASVRLRTFVEQAAQATLIGDVFDDAATGQGLLNYFIRGINCGAILKEEALATGLTVEEIRSRSFVNILKRRQKGETR